jgi:hypothetical protein
MFGDSMSRNIDIQTRLFFKWEDQVGEEAARQRPHVT